MELFIGPIAFIVLWVLSVVNNMTGMVLDMSALVIMICLIRLLFRKHIRAGVMYSLWGLVAVRFIGVPIFSLLGSVFQKLFRTSTVNVINFGADQVREWIAPAGGQMALEGVAPARVNLLAFSAPGWFLVIWFLGIIIVYVWSVYVNEKFRHKLFDERITISMPDCRYPVYKVPGIISPCVMRVKGKKGIYLTEEVAEDKEKREYVLAHETCHLEHRDLFWGKIRCIVLACNWFNPLIWVAAILSKRDGEMACDERAIRKLGESRRIYYGRVLVDIVADTMQRRNLFFTATTMCSGKQEMKKRIQKIADGRDRVLLSAGVFILTVLVACMTSFVTQAEIKGLSAEETVQQYLYYWNHDYHKGMESLRVDYARYKNEGTVVIKRCEDTTFSNDHYIDINDIEGMEDKQFYEMRRLRIDIHRTVVETDYETMDEVTKQGNYEEEFLLVRETEESDWKILASTMDEVDMW